MPQYQLTIQRVVVEETPFLVEADSWAEAIVAAQEMINKGEFELGDRQWSDPEIRTSVNY